MRCIIKTARAPADPAPPAPAAPAAAAPAAPKKQTAPATKAARADFVQDPQPASRSEPDPERRSSDKAERAAKKELGDIGEGQFADINQQTEMMMMEAAPQEDIGDTLVRQQDYAGEFAPSIEDLEQAKREPLGETAGRLAIQGFMQRNFGFRPEVTFDVEEQEPGGTGSLF